MALWLKLTSLDGSPVRINMDMMVDYVENLNDKNTVEGTFIAMNDSGIAVREKLSEIDDAIIRVKSKLRLVEGW